MLVNPVGVHTQVWSQEAGNPLPSLEIQKTGTYDVGQSSYTREVANVVALPIAQKISDIGAPAPIATEKYSGKNWIAATQFIPMAQGDVLARTMMAVQQAVERHQRPVVILDLDSTMYSPAARNFKIMKEWLATPEVQNGNISVRQAFEQLQHEHIAYDMEDTFKNLGLDLKNSEVQAALRSIKKFWFQRFFTDAYVTYDQPNPGAVAFAQTLHRLGARIVYLTGRDEPNMSVGTKAALTRDGFPFDPKGGSARLILKPEFKTDDATYKRQAAEVIRTMGTVVAAYDNEPANITVFSEKYPNAMKVFVDTEYSSKPTEAGVAIYRVKDFRF